MHLTLSSDKSTQKSFRNEFIQSRWWFPGKNRSKETREGEQKVREETKGMGTGCGYWGCVS